MLDIYVRLAHNLCMATNKTQTAMDRFAAAVENDKMQSRFMEDLDDEPFSQFDGWAESLTEVAEAIGAAKDAIEGWQFAEGRDEKADAKESALEASPLDLSNLTDWSPDDV